MEFDIIWNQQWNADMVIIFQTVIFQRVRLVSGARNIRDQITSRLDFWNKVTYNKLLQDSYGAMAYYLGKARGTQIKEQNHCNFENIILNGKFHKSVRFICERETGEVLLPNDWATESTSFTDKTVAEVLAGVNPPKRKTCCYTL